MFVKLNGASLNICHSKKDLMIVKLNGTSPLSEQKWHNVYQTQWYYTQNINLSEGCQDIVISQKFVTLTRVWQVFENALSHWQGCNTALSESCHTIYWQICDKLICHFLPKFVTKLSGISQGIPYDVIASFWNVYKFEFMMTTDNFWISSICKTSVFWVT
jgi:hypothetical protein